MEFSSYLSRAKEFLRECVRVLRITKKPTREEYKTIVKVAGLGMILIGLIGFIIVMLKTLIFDR